MGRVVAYDNEMPFGIVLSSTITQLPWRAFVSRIKCNKRRTRKYSEPRKIVMLIVNKREERIVIDN